MKTVDKYCLGLKVLFLAGRLKSSSIRRRKVAKG